MRRAGLVFLAALGGLASMASLGFHLSDEATLAVGAHNLYRGDLGVHDVPETYYVNAATDWSGQRQVLLDTAWLTESRAGAALSFPAYLLLRAWSPLAPVSSLFVLVAIGALAGAAALLAAQRWPDHRRPTAIAALVAGLLVASQARGAQPIDPLWLPPLAMQLTTILLVAAGAALFHRLVAYRRSDRAATWSTLILLMGTSVPFWAFGQKNHGMEVGLLCIALSLRFGPDSRLAHRALAYAVLAVATWMQPRVGGVALVAFATYELALVIRSPRELRAHARRAGAFSLALALGLVPYAVENTLLNGAPWALVQLGPIVGPATEVGEPEGVPTGEPEEGRAGEGAVAPPTEVARTAVARATLDRGSPMDGGMLRVLAWTWIGPRLLTPEVEVQFGILMVAPFVALAPLALVARRQDGLDALVWLHLLLLVTAYGSHAATPGKGAYDTRFFQVLFPGLALQAGVVADALTREWERKERVAMAASVVALLAGASGLFAALPPDYTLQFTMLRRVGLAAAVLVLAGGMAGIVARQARATRGFAFQAVGVSVAAIALCASLLFLVQFTLHHPPRALPSSGGGLTHFALPGVERAHEALLRRWGA